MLFMWWRDGGVRLVREIMARVVVLYDADFLKKFRVYFDEANQRVKFEHGMRNWEKDSATGERERIKPDFVHLVTVQPSDLQDPGVVNPVVLDSWASKRDSDSILGYDEQYLWLYNVNRLIPVEGGQPLIAEVLCRWFHHHERFGDGIDNDDESVERDVEIVNPQHRN